MLKDNLLAGAVILLAIAVLISGLSITAAMKIDPQGEIKKHGEQEFALMNSEAAAAYLGITHDDFYDILKEDAQERERLSSYSTYRFIPFIEISRQKYYTKDELNKWIEHNMLNKYK